MLSTISLAQQAALDPEILRSSNSLAVSVLEASGVVESAIQGGSTKRTIVSDAVAAAEADDEQTLVFSQSVVGLNLLAEDLKNRHGVHAPVYCGAMGSEEADRVRSAFQRGEIRTLLLSPIAKEGLNLRRRSCSTTTCPGCLLTSSSASDGQPERDPLTVPWQSSSRS